MFLKPRKMARVSPHRVNGVGVRITLYSNSVPCVATTTELISTIYSTFSHIAGMIEPLRENSKTRMEGFCGWMIITANLVLWREKLRAIL
ncbi:hypothetical protein D3C77_583050 [compost metagenome]